MSNFSLAVTAILLTCSHIKRGMESRQSKKTTKNILKNHRFKE